MEKLNNLCSDEDLKTSLLVGHWDDLYGCLWEKCFPPIRKLITGLGGSEQDAIDIFVDAVVILFEHSQKKNFVLSAKVSTYLYAVSRNQWLKLYKKKTQLLISPLDKYPLVHWNDENEWKLLTRDYQKEVQAIMACMEKMGQHCDSKISRYCKDPGAYQRKFEELQMRPTCIIHYLYYYEETTYDKIAEITGMTRAGVHARHQTTCKPQLRKCLVQNYPGLFDDYQ